MLTTAGEQHSGHARTKEFYRLSRRKIGHHPSSTSSGVVDLNVSYWGHPGASTPIQATAGAQCSVILCHDPHLNYMTLRQILYYGVAA